MLRKKKKEKTKKKSKCFFNYVVLTYIYKIILSLDICSTVGVFGTCWDEKFLVVVSAKTQLWRRQSNEEWKALLFLLNSGSIHLELRVIPICSTVGTRFTSTLYSFVDLSTASLVDCSMCIVDTSKMWAKCSFPSAFRC